MTQTNTSSERSTADKTTEKRTALGILGSIFLTFVATLIGFFVGMALSIAGVAIVAAIRHVPPNFSITYSYCAPPVAAIFFIGAVVYFIRHRA